MENSDDLWPRPDSRTSVNDVTTNSSGKHLFKYDQCMNTFEQAGSLNNHKLTHSGEKKTHKCSQCSKLFARAENLRNHMMTHTGEKSLKCAQCGNSLNRAADLKKVLAHPFW